MQEVSNVKHHKDWDEKVYCAFKHVPSEQAGTQITRNIESIAKAQGFDKTVLPSCARNGNGEGKMILTRRECNNVRDRLQEILTEEFSSVWFTILSKPLHSLVLRTLRDESNDNVANISKFQVSCQFGALRSYDKFYSHVSFDNKLLDVSFQNVHKRLDSLCIQWDEHRRILISLSSIQKKNILVNKVKLSQGIYVLLPLRYAPRIIYTSESNGRQRQNRMCDNEKSSKLVRTIGKSSDVVLHFGPQQVAAWSFLTQLISSEPEKYEINFGTFTVSDWRADARGSTTPDPFHYASASFEDRYALQMLTSRGFVFRDKWAELTDADLKWNQWPQAERYALCVYASERLQQDHGYDLRRTKSDYDARLRSTPADDSCIFIDPKERLQVAVCTLTPLRIIFQPLDLTSGSRALRNRQFGGPKNFLLVHFREENNKDLRASDPNIKSVLKEKMRDGIQSVGGTFKFMGASTGQLKEMAFWFIHLPSNLKTIADARNVLGDFSSIKNIATYIARVGQFFSTTWHLGIQLTLVKNREAMAADTSRYYVRVIEDVKRNGRCFTDGIGKISWGLAGRIAQKMNLQLLKKDDIPSAFQVRVAGCKGMLAIDPDSTLNDYYIEVRDSMMKFTSSDWNLEICEYSRPITLTLNNQVIRLLADLGNPSGAFRRLQSCGLSRWQVPEEEQPSIIDMALHRNISYASAKENLLKNRIPIPPHEGRNLFGVVDETETLEYGQCFIKVSSLEPGASDRGVTQIITGSIIVTKNPCLWPGDFRRLTAVHNKKLEECMCDVIVFPMKGKRPHPNEISGSDLDGDQYWVYWGKDFHVDKDVEPLAYGSSPKAEVSSITQEIIIDHIVESFGAGGIVGMIANTHTAAADKAPEHSFSTACRELAELFSTAVDSPKTGKIVKRDEIQKYQQKYCGDWPHFLMKLDERTYRSDSILEDLFFEAKEHFFTTQETPTLHPSQPQQMRARRGGSSVQIHDQAFKRWLEGGSYQGKKGPEPAKPKEPKPAPNVLNRSSHDHPPTMLSPCHSASAQTPLINSDAAGLTASSLPTATEMGSARLVVELLMGVAERTAVTTSIQFTPVGPSLYTVALTKGGGDASDRDSIVRKVTSYLEKQDVFKKKPALYDTNKHGPLRLVIRYGRICFVEQNPFPSKLGKLQELVESNHDQWIRFQPASFGSLPSGPGENAAVSKHAIVYAVDCLANKSSVEYMSLLFDASKTLRRIHVSHLWTRCYVRQPYLRADNVYELRSVLAYDEKSPGFSRVKAEIFTDPNKVDLLKGRKPKIEIDRPCLRASVVLLRVRVIEQELMTLGDRHLGSGFIREVKYVPVDKPVEGARLTSTMEFYNEFTDKNAVDLEQICRYSVDLCDHCDGLDAS